MNVIVLIDGQEAVPIRALPFLTGWTMSPDVVAQTFAHRDGWITKLENICAFQLSNDDSYAATLPKEWDGILAELEGLKNMLQISEQFEDENYPAWRRDSIQLLPPACFVWKDEFEKAFKLAYSKEDLAEDKRPGDRELNFFPLIPEKLQKSVMQGFERPETKIITEKPLLTRERDTVLKLVIGMAISGYKYNSDAARNDAIGEISRDLESLGISLDQNTIRKWITEASKLLPSKPIKT